MKRLPSLPTWTIPGLGVLCLLLLTDGNAQVERPIGINFSGVHDYSTELVFTDAFKQARTWITFNADGSGPWSTGGSIPLNEQGYPLRIPYDDGVNPPQAIRTLMLWDIGDAAPTGMYRLVAEGTGTIQLRFGLNATLQCPVDTLLYTEGQVALEILASEEGDPIRNIQFIYPDYVDTYQEKTFTDEFLAFATDFQVFRFMDWLRTNGATISSWSDRTPGDYYSQSQSNGVAWEYIVELCNLLEKDPWICIPHRADDNYISELAQFLDENLAEDLTLYLEYSNEVWNGQFLQNSEAAQFAADLGYTGESWERTWKYTAKRSADIFRLFSEVFEDERLVKIIPSQAANSWLSNQIITFFNDPFYNPSEESADALAIAPYFAGRVANDIVDEGLVASITTAEIIERMENSLEESYNWMSANAEVANQHALRLMTYEGGQHLVGTGASVNNDALTEKLVTANRDAAMQDLYCQYFDHWYETHGDLFANFSSHYRANRYGSWGIKETMQDVENPKYLGLQECVVSYNFEVTGVGEALQNDQYTIFPNPSQDIIRVSQVDGSESVLHLTLVDAFGRVVRQTRPGSQSLSVVGLAAGWYVLLIDDTQRESRARKRVLVLE